jgi:protein N-terminal glutamine amidohydrolase
MNRDDCLYTPYYCEENIYKLYSHPEMIGHECDVVFVSNPERRVLMFGQQRRYQWVEWDYHVILLVDRCKVYDLDTVFGFPEGLANYKRLSFPSELPKTFPAKAKLIPASHFLDCFYSDRRHMVDQSGEYRAPPPPWPAIRPEMGSNIDEFIDMENDAHGRVLSSEQLVDYFSGGD